jgi:hypothetical protein
LEIHSEPIFPSECPFNNVDTSLINTEISRSDPCVAVSEELMANEIDDSNIIDGSDKADEINNSHVTEIHSSNLAHQNSAFTKVTPSSQPLTTNEVGEIPKVEELSLLMTTPEGAEGFDIPELTYLDESTSQMFNTALSADNNSESSDLETLSDILNNTDTINVPLQDHIHGSVSPLSGNIPPHNTPVIGSNRGEINLQDVQLALTQAFNDELANEQHMENGHDFRRSVSADVHHEKDKEHGMRLRHNSGI